MSAGRAAMRAKDIMTTQVTSVTPETTVRDVALLLAEKGFNAVPVIDHGAVIGVISEGDLLHRQELGTAGHRRRSPWFRLFEDRKLAARFEEKAHGMRAADVMTRNVISVTEDCALPEIADTLERNNIKQLLVMRGDKLTGIVSRANIVRALAARPEDSHSPTSSDDDEIRYKIIEILENMPGTSPWQTTVIVRNGVVDLYGTVEEESTRGPSRLAVEKLTFVLKVRDHRTILQPF
jgi:CBS domain-containing protein